MLRIILILLLIVASQPIGGQEVASSKVHPEDWASPDTLAAAVYSLVSGPAGQPRPWDRYRALFAEGARFTSIGESDKGVEIHHFGVEDYIRYYESSFLERGIKEWESQSRTEQYRHMAQRWGICEYRWSDEEGPVSGRSQVAMQFIHDGERWWILGMTWEVESAEDPLPSGSSE